MKHPTLTMLLAVLILLSALPAVPPVAQAAEPTTFRGIMRYTENGPGAGVDGIATSLLVGGAGGGVAVARLQSIVGLLDALPGLGEVPSMASVSSYLNESVPIDLAGLLPVSARYEANIEFTLAQQSDGTFQLQEGSVRWTVANSAEVSGDGTYIVDRFSGSGQHQLDPATDVISLAFETKQDRLVYELTVEIGHPAPTNGESTWSAAEGAMVLWLRAKEGVQTIGGNTMGQEIPEQVVGAGVPEERGIYYTHTGPVSELKYMETWRNLLDAQVLAEYEIYDECSASITSPSENEKVTLDTIYKSSLDLEIEAEVVPEAWAEDLTWELPAFGEKEPNYDPEDRRGDKTHAWYEGPAPESNSAFGPFEIEARFDEVRGTCDDPELRNVRIFFPRDRYNNPDPSGRVPNWFYYWTDTAAAQGHKGAIIYDEDDDGYGHYDGFIGADWSHVIYIGDIFAAGNPSANPVTGKVTEGIDLFASTVLHEWTHLENNLDWWGAGGYVHGSDDDGNWLPDPRDADADLVPDDREAAYGLSPRTKDSLGFGFRDSEYPAYLQENTWPNGSANREDWADPGKQSE